MKLCWAVVLGVWLDQPVLLTALIEGGESEEKEYVDQCHEDWAEQRLTGRLVQGWLYRSSDHLICSLADWRTCGRKLGLTKQITPTTKV